MHTDNYVYYILNEYFYKSLRVVEIDYNIIHRHHLYIIQTILIGISVLRVKYIAAI